ncbi:hypothetical protein GOODEAATRI_005726, partial [Goodea atripinnis]
ALQEKVESLQRQLQCAEKKLLSKELETEERVMKLFVLFPQSLLFPFFSAEQSPAYCHYCITFFNFAISLLHHNLHSLLDHAAFSVALKTCPLTPTFAAL